MTVSGDLGGRDADLTILRNGNGLHFLRLVLVALAVIAIGVLGWRLFDTGVRQVPTILAESGPTGRPGDLSAAGTAAAAKIAAAPDYPRFFDRLRVDLPADYRAILDGLTQRAETGEDKPDVDRWISDAIRALRVSSGVLAARADGPTLERVFVLQRQVLGALAGEDKRLCVDFLYGGASRGFDRFAAGHRALVTDFALANLDAIVSGRQTKAARGAPTDADFDGLEAALRDKGLSQPEIAAILDGRQPDPPIEDPRLCEIGGIYLDTLAQQPEAARLRIYGLAAELMARS